MSLTKKHCRFGYFIHSFFFLSLSLLFPYLCLSLLHQTHPLRFFFSMVEYQSLVAPTLCKNLIFSLGENETADILEMGNCWGSGGPKLALSRSLTTQQEFTMNTQRGGALAGSENKPAAGTTEATIEPFWVGGNGDEGEYFERRGSIDHGLYLT